MRQNHFYFAATDRVNRSFIIGRKYFRIFGLRDLPNSNTVEVTPDYQIAASIFQPIIRSWS